MNIILWTKLSLSRKALIFNYWETGDVHWVHCQSLISFDFTDDGDVKSATSEWDYHYNNIKLLYYKSRDC